MVECASTIPQQNEHTKTTEDIRKSPMNGEMREQKEKDPINDSLLQDCALSLNFRIEKRPSACNINLSPMDSNKTSK